MIFHSKRAVVDNFAKAKEDGANKWRDTLPTWCPGCGHFTALQGLYEATDALGIEAKDFAVVSGIGCSGRFPFFVKGFGFHSLHGRALPVATGMKIANPDLTVVVVGGDGDGLGIGGGHLPHAARNNLDLTYILLDNNIYGLTKGQISPTSPMGMLSGTSPYGNIARPLNPATLAITYGATFVARVFSRDRHQTSQMIRAAMEHKGFSFVHLLSPCVEFNKLVTYKTWAEKVTPLESEYEPLDKTAALLKTENKDHIYTGLFFEENIDTFNDHVQKVKADLKK